MQANDFSPYALKDLYQAIDLIDRKIAHYTTTENFASHETREADLRKFSSKRTALVRSALALTSLGVRCDPQFLPRSFVPAVREEALSLAEAPVAAAASKSRKSARPRQKRS
jgi:hypothetical protein